MDALTNTNIAGMINFYDQICCRLGGYGYGVTKVQCNRSKGKWICLATLKGPWTQASMGSVVINEKTGDQLQFWIFLSCLKC